MNILVIEDNEQNLYLVRFLLEACGHRISEARDGAEGIAAARVAVPDLVPVVAVTSYAMNGDRVKALAAGCDAYIEKPIDPDTFAAEVEAAAAAGRREQKGHT